MKVTVSTYKTDKYYPRIVKAVAELLLKSDVVTPAEVLIKMGNLARSNFEAWRKGQVTYLERVIEGNLSKINRIIRIIGIHAHDLNMAPSPVVYRQLGKGKCRILQFTKSGDKKLEEAYSRHYLWNQSSQKKQGIINSAKINTSAQIHQGANQHSTSAGHGPGQTSGLD